MRTTSKIIRGKWRKKTLFEWDNDRVKTACSLEKAKHNKSKRETLYKLVVLLPLPRAVHSFNMQVHVPSFPTDALGSTAAFKITYVLLPSLTL